MRSRYVDVNLGLMDGTPRGVATPQGRGDVLTLNLFSYQSPLAPEVSVTVVRDRVAPATRGAAMSGRATCKARTPPSTRSLIAVEGGIMIANVRANGSNYQVRYSPAGVQTIYEVDERQIHRTSTCR